jgi:hypothetical protein
MKDNMLYLNRGNNADNYIDGSQNLSAISEVNAHVNTDTR